MSTHPNGTLASLYRYPVKGLSAEVLPHAALTPGQTLRADRRYAIASTPIEFDPAHPTYYPKIRFLMLMRHERLARLHSRFDESSNILSIACGGAEVARGNLESETGRALIEDFFAENFADELSGPPKILSAPDHSFSDVAEKVVSIVNLASVAAIEDAIGQPIDPLRFRANLYVDDWPAWLELELTDGTIGVGGTRLKVMRDIVRCAAVNVDPAKAERDLNIPQALMRSFGHLHCGIYAKVIAGGDIALGDPVKVLSLPA